MSDAPVQAESVAPKAAPVEAPASGGAVPEASAAPTGAPAPTAADDPWPTVEWDSWDGEVDSLPEQYHESAQGISNWYRQDFDEKSSEIDNLRAMYAAMLSEQEDPRIGEMTTKLEELQGQFDSRNKEYEELQAKLTQTEDHAVEDYVTRFWKDHQELKEDPEKLAQLSLLLADNEELGGMWDGYVAAQLVYLSEDAAKIAVEAKKNGVPDDYALKLAMAHAQLEEANAQPTPEEIAVAQKQAAAEAKAKAPRAGAKITNGATGSSRPQVAKKSMGDASSFDEMRLLAARRAFSMHNGGRR